MAIDIVPEWMADLNQENMPFTKNFLLVSGSPKEIANQYGVTHPTIRFRLDKLIQKTQMNRDISNEPYISLIKQLAVSDKTDFDTAKVLISEYKKLKGGE